MLSGATRSRHSRRRLCQQARCSLAVHIPQVLVPVSLCARGAANHQNVQGTRDCHTGPGFGFATASFSQHGRLATPRRRADRARAVHKAAGTFANVCPERRESMGAAVQAITALQCSLTLRRCATAAKHVWTSRTALLRCSRLAARSRPTTQSTRGSWRGLTHDLCYPSAGPAAVSQRASFLAPSC